MSVEAKQQEVANVIGQRLSADLVHGKAFEMVELPSDGMLYVRYDGEMYSVTVAHAEEEE